MLSALTISCSFILLAQLAVAAPFGDGTVSWNTPAGFRYDSTSASDSYAPSFAPSTSRYSGTLPSLPSNLFSGSADTSGTNAGPASSASFSSTQVSQRSIIIIASILSAFVVCVFLAGVFQRLRFRRARAAGAASSGWTRNPSEPVAPSTGEARTVDVLALPLPALSYASRGAPRPPVIALPSRAARRHAARLNAPRGWDDDERGGATDDDEDDSFFDGFFAEAFRLDARDRQAAIERTLRIQAERRRMVGVASTGGATRVNGTPEVMLRTREGEDEKAEEWVEPPPPYGRR